MLIISHDREVSGLDFRNKKMNSIVPVITVTIVILLWKNVECVSTTKEPVESTTEVESTERLTTDEESTTKYEILTNITSTITPIPHLRDYWMTKMGVIKDDLLRIQAVIVKDEDVYTTICSEGSLKSPRRHLMCAGSILNRNRVLTSASCIHESMHIRHNVRAPLTVVIAPLRSTVQIIKVAEYRIHPRHNANPHSEYHATHNLAILSLACRISAKNYYKVELPTQPMTHICTEENCFVAVYRKTGYTTHVMYQMQAPFIPLYDRRRRSVSYDEEEEFGLSTEMSSYRMIGSNETVKRISKRSNDGVHSCTQTGAPVMINSTQAAVVAVSCDDRQSTGKWRYTDLFKNLDWIHNILNDWNRTDPTMTDSKTPKTNTSAPGSKSCGNCIFNFYISVGCKEKGNCPKGVNQSSTIPPQVRLQPMARFHPNWPQVQGNPAAWSPESLQANDILRPHRSSLKKCPNNSRECLRSSANINGAHRLVPVHRIRPGSTNRKIEKFVNDPIAIRGRNQSLVNGLEKYNLIYRKNDGTKNLGNRSWVLRKPERPLKFRNKNVYVLKNPLDKKIVDRDMGNWLRRRHANGYSYPVQKKREALVTNDTDFIY